MSRLDLIDAVEAAARGAGLDVPVLSSLPPSRDVPECCIVSMGVPLLLKRDWGGTKTQEVRVTVIAKRRRKADAERDASAVGAAIEASGLASASGGYRVVDKEVPDPSQIAWDESGFFVYALDANITYKVRS